MELGICSGEGVVMEEIVKKKNGDSGSLWLSTEVRSSHGCSLWKSIRSLREQLSKLVRYEVGDVKRIRFWHDIWCMDVVLKEWFPYLFTVGMDKDVLVDLYLAFLKVELECGTRLLYAAFKIGNRR